MAEPGESTGLASAFTSPTFGKDGSFRVDKPVGSASISPCGRDIVLASRQGLHIIDLDSPWSPPWHLPHRTPWEVADVQWSPFAARDYWVVSTSNQKALVWNLAMSTSQSAIEHVLHAHTRAITDINFSAHHPDILATCAVDSFVHCWDLRHPARPAITFCDWFAGATQVKWNRQDSHIIASSHDRFLRIWDDRKGAYPLRSIEAHATKIYGVDWNRTSANEIVTCSLDRTIKFWDYANHVDQPERTIHTPFPVWRARHTPFGCGLLAMPQRGDPDLYLYDRRLEENWKRDDFAAPVHQFEGHDNQVKEFLWRPRGSIINGHDNREFQLVSWGTDRMLRLHHVDEQTMCRVGYEKGEEVQRKINFTRINATYKTFREDLPKHGGTLQKTTSTIGFSVHKPLSVGMSKAPMPVSVGWGDWGQMNMQKKAPTKAVSSTDTDAISWMRGVKIGKREVTSSSLYRSTAPFMSPSLNGDITWNTFDSLGEEITHVGDKFVKVALNEIDVQNRVLTASLPGPWGHENKAIYLKARFSFPDSYPNESTPKLALEQTASTSEGTISRLQLEVQVVMDACLSRQRSSLEACLRFLLGEQNLEESLAWLTGNRENNNSDFIQDGLSSSSDEDDDAIGEMADSHEMDANGSGLLTGSNANANVPLPKTCGALWADDRLICFFPPKEEKAHGLLDSMSLKAGDRASRSHKNIFEGFGRLHSASPLSKRAVSTSEIVESDDSSSGDLFMSSSSTSSSSNEVGLRGHRHFYPPDTWRGNVFEIRRADFGEESQKSSGGTGAAKMTKSKSKFSVSIHDCRELLPAQRELAEKYITNGEASECCVHNSQIAESAGFQDLADIWSFVNLILRNDVPLERIPHPRKDESVMVVARRALTPLKSKDSGIDLSFDLTKEQSQHSPRGHVKWGQHPFGGRWLVDMIIRHFEQLADIQMLAMLSCVLKEPLPTSILDRSNVEDQHLIGRMLMPNHFSVDSFSKASGQKTFYSYFASPEVARSLLEPTSFNPSIRLKPRESFSEPHSTTSSADATFSDPVTFSTGATPPSNYRHSHAGLERSNSQTQSISTSPEQHRFSHRSNSNLASAFAASFSRPFSFSASASSSPPTTNSRKRLSPAESYAGAHPQGVSWSAANVFRSTITEHPKPHTASGSETEEDTTVPKRPVFRASLKNQDQFDKDGYATIPFLDPSQSWRYRAYREAYAHLLLRWEMPIAMCEVLKYNDGSPSPTTSLFPRSARGTESSKLAIGKIPADIAKADTLNLQVNFRHKCTTCATALDHQQSNQRCKKCATYLIPLTCVFCAELVRGLASPCLSCGHVLHFKCRLELLSLKDTSDGLGDVCISGDGCHCSDHNTVEVELPKEPERLVSPVIIAESADEQEQQGWQGADDDDDAWEDVAYESLARNLGGRYVKPKSSQIWRGRG